MVPDPTRLIFGTNPLSTMPSRRAVFSLLETVAATGVLHWDTARAYGRGYGERLVGEFLRAHGLHVALTAKVGLGDVQTSRIPTWAALRANGLRRRRPIPSSDESRTVERPPGLQLDDIRRSLDETLRCLQVKSVDTLLLHENLPSGLGDPARTFLLSLVHDGTVQRLGAGTNVDVLDAFYEPVDGFTVLQYEGAGRQGASDLLTRFPEAVHYRHGFLRDLGHNNPTEALAAAQRADPAGKVVFSTRSVPRLRQNLGLSLRVTS